MTFLLFGRCGLSEFVKKGKFVTKFFFSDMYCNVDWISKNLWKMISADVKAIYIIKTRYKISGGCIYLTNFYKN